MTNETLYLGDNPLIASSAAVQGDYVTRDGESYYRIANVDGMDDFFISVVSDSNHWMFISTRGGLSAGRTDCDSALFPYYTEGMYAVKHREIDMVSGRRSPARASVLSLPPLSPSHPPPRRPQPSPRCSSMPP